MSPKRDRDESEIIWAYERVPVKTREEKKSQANPSTWKQQLPGVENAADDVWAGSMEGPVEVRELGELGRINNTPDAAPGVVLIAGAARLSVARATHALGVLFVDECIGNFQILLCNLISTVWKLEGGKKL